MNVVGGTTLFTVLSVTSSAHYVIQLSVFVIILFCTAHCRLWIQFALYLMSPRIDTPFAMSKKCSKEFQLFCCNRHPQSSSSLNFRTSTETEEANNLDVLSVRVLIETDVVVRGFVFSATDCWHAYTTKTTKKQANATLYCFSGSRIRQMFSMVDKCWEKVPSSMKIKSDPWLFTATR